MTINVLFRIGAYNVRAEAYFSGKNLQTEITVDGHLIENASSTAADYYTFTGLKGAALKAHDKKWLREYATNAIMAHLLHMAEETAAA